MAVSEETIETFLRVIRTADIHEAREWLRQLCASCRQDGMVDMMKAIDSSGETQERLQALKEKMDAYLETPVKTADDLFKDTQR
jgi:CheY-like chemotaxis protein